jgi:DNA-binding XRE family transcriptional regulator
MSSDIHERIDSVEGMLIEVSQRLDAIKDEIESGEEEEVALSEQLPELDGLDFSHRMKRLRGWRQMTQGDLSKETGLSLSAIYKLETGKTSPRASNVGRIASALGVPFVILDVEV